MTDRLSVRELTTQLENNNGQNAPAFFAGKFEEERFKDLDAIRQLNQKDLAEGKTKTTLDCHKGFYYNDNIDIRAISGAWSDFNGGNLVYSDVLDLHTLKHSNAGDNVPTRPLGAIAAADLRKLTDAAEAGNGKAIETALAGKQQEERISLLNKMSDLNQADIAAHKTGVFLQVEVAGPKGSAGNMSVTRVRPGIHDSWMGGLEIYHETLDADNYKRETTATIDQRK